MDLRRDAELRAAALQSQRRQIRNSAKDLISPEKHVDELIDAENVDNPTPEIARIAAVDFKLNGGRARCNTGEFVAPRWIPDEEVTNCASCRANFDWVKRRHHCRHCGRIFCDECSGFRALLPQDFGMRDPQRICEACHAILEPMQNDLTSVLSNHQRVNTIDVDSGNCSYRRYFNLPFSQTLGSEIRKAAYTTHNLFSNNWIKDGSVPIGLIAEAKGLAYLTVIKGGFILAPRVGTGLVISRLPNNKWSAPSAIGTIGLSWGALVGAEVTDYVIILNTKEAVDAFSGQGQVAIGAGIDVALGPVGRWAE